MATFTLNSCSVTVVTPSLSHAPYTAGYADAGNNKISLSAYIKIFRKEKVVEE